MRKGVWYGLLTVWYGLLTGLALLLAACGGQPPTGLTLAQPDLTLVGISPQNPAVVQGQAVTLTLTFTSQNGFQGQVSSSVLEGGQPVSWLSPNAVQRNLNVPRGQQVQETLEVQVDPNAPTGSQNLTVRAAYGNQVTERALTLTVSASGGGGDGDGEGDGDGDGEGGGDGRRRPRGDFTISLSSDSLTVQQGSNSQTTLTVTPQNGFTGRVNLALVAGQDRVPRGLTLSPRSVRVSGTSPVNQSLTLSAKPATPTGTYRLKVRATSRRLTREADLTLTVSAPGGGGSPDFTISLNPTSLTVQQGSSGTTQLTLTPQNGFTGPVSLALVAGQDQVPQGLTLSPDTVQVGTSSLTLSAQSTTPTGTYRLKVRGTSGSLVKEVDLTLTVTAPLRVTLDWTPLAQAAGPDGSDGPIALSGTLEGTPSAPLKLQVSYRPKGRDWGPWQEAGQVQVQGGQITATLPGLELPVGLDELGKKVRVRLVAGDQALAQSPELLLQRFQPLWRASVSEANRPLQELSAAGSLACGYWDPFDGVRRKLYCFDPATGNPAWSYDLPLAPRDVFVAGDGRVFVGGDSNFQARVLVLQGGTLLAQYDLSADFAVVTALALEGDTLYVGGSRYVQAPCGSTTRQILRVRFAKYRVAGSFLTRLALHDPTPQDLQEITSPNGCTGSGDDYSPYNWSSTPALRLEGGKVYAVFSVGLVWTGSDLSDSSCLGFLRLDAATFARDWLTRPTRQGANGEASWSRECSSSWTWSGWYFYIGSAPPAPAIWYALRSFDLDATRLFASSTGSEALLKETGGVVPVPGRGGALLFLPGFPEGLVRFPVSSANRLLAYPGGTEGPYVLNLEVNYEYFVAVFKDPEGRVYAYSDSTDLVVRLR